MSYFRNFGDAANLQEDPASSEPVEHVISGRNVPLPVFRRTLIVFEFRFATTISGMLSLFTSMAAVVCGLVPTA